MKKFISAIIVIALAMSMTGAVWPQDVGVPELSAEAQTGEIYSVSDSSTWIPYEVVGGNIYFDPETQNIVGCDSTVTEAVIPAEIDGKAVRMIVSMKPTSSVSQLQKVVISDGIMAISEHAFEDTALREIQIPDSVDDIGAAAFKKCMSLVSINLPPNIKYITNEMFIYCYSLKSISIPYGVESIGSWAFDFCYSLESIDIPDTVTSIGSWAFDECTSLESVYIPDSLTYITRGAFSGCTSLREINVGENNPMYYSEDGILFSENTLLIYPMAKPDKEFTVNCSSIASDSRDMGLGICRNPYLSILKFTDGRCLSSSSASISNLVSLKEVYLPLNTGSIGADIFSGCYSITDVYYDGCEERWENVKKSSEENNGSLFMANVHFNENDHIIQGVELEVGENASVARFESESGKSYQYNTYYQSKPFSLMENSALVAMLDGNDLKVKVLIPGWDRVIYEFSRYNTVSTNTAEYTLENVVPQSGETHIEVDLDMLGTTAYLGDIYVDCYGNLRTELGTGTNTYTVYGTGFPVDLPVHFGSADLDEAYGGELSDYEVEVYYIENGAKVTVGREKMSAGSAHEHIFGSDWEYDTLNHWHVCTKCSQTSDPEPHIIENGICTVCNYIQPEHVHHFICVGTDDVHWDLCEECGYTTNVREHTYNGEVCTDCGHKNTPKFDVNGDGEITLTDAIEVLKMAMKVTS